MVADPREMMRFFLGVTKMVVKEFRTTMLINKMDVSHLIIHSQQVEEEKLKECSREAKRAKSGDGDFSHSRSNRLGCSWLSKWFYGKISSNHLAQKFSKVSVSKSIP